MKKTKIIHPLLIRLLILLFLLLTGCTQPTEQAPSTTATGPYWPTTDWHTSTPQAQGMDPAVLEKMQEEIRTANTNLHSMLIIRHGYIVSETYYPPFKQNTRHQMFSVTKSFISTLVGIAVDQGKIAIDDRVLDRLPQSAFDNLDESKQAMTIKDLLTMTSGLDWQEGDPIYRKMYMSRDWIKMVMDLPMQDQPGENFVYCSGCSHVLSGAVQQASGSTTEAFARTHLFEPLGIRDYDWEQDPQGIALGGWGLNIIPRDMAKLGLLYLHNGQWDGKQIVSSDWVKAATSPQVDAAGRLDYGYQWWIYDSHQAYVALGRDGQTIWVSPELDLIVVATAAINDHDPVFDLIDRFVVEAVNAVR